MQGSSAPTSSGKLPVAAVRTKKSVYARHVGAGRSRSSSSAEIPNSSAYARCSDISVVSVAWASSARRVIASRSGARADASDSIRA